MKNLVIVESPTKARTIGRFLGKDFEIKASMGHIMDLPKSKLGVNLEKDFEPEYELVKDKSKVINELKSEAKKAELVILATDPDREGEAIASHVRDVLAEKDKNLKFKRIVFHEITESAVNDALSSPRDIDTHLVNAQTARRVLDRLVGYKLSPILWQKVRRGLSAGRVQSVALRLIVEREREIEKFKKEKYYTVSALLKGKTGQADFELLEIDGAKIETQKKLSLYDGDYTVSLTSITDEKKALEIESDVLKKDFKIAEVVQKEVKRSPYAPFTTSTLQQEAARRLGYSGKRTMSVAQKLYEEGFITYHRTDSVIQSTQAVLSIRGYVEKIYGPKYIPEKPRFYKTKQKLAQEAHEAIRPTKFTVSHQSVESDLGKEYSKLYDIIFRRALSSQMSDAIMEQTTVFADSNDKKYRFKTNGSVMVFEGFLKVNPQALEDRRLPDFKANEALDTQSVSKEEHETSGPPRYNDASIIKTLEEKGIGRPSTYASIISTLEARRYIERQDAKFIPTNVGIAVNDFLVDNFSDIDDIPFTASMEDDLDEIAGGRKEWVPTIRAFYEPFAVKLEDVKKAERVKIDVEETGEICPKDGGKLVIRIGRFGKFISCANFPKCDFTKPLVEDTGLICPKDGGKIVLKRTRKGRKFYGCGNYPKCDFAAWKLEDIKKSAPQTTT